MEPNPELTAFKVIIRVVKSLKDGNSFGSEDIVREPLIYAENKAAVKEIILEKYPQFFPNQKIYEKQTKDSAQFFYVLIFPLYESEKMLIKEGEWTCDGCGQVHSNRYISRPRIYHSFSKIHKFCSIDNDDYCLNLYKKTHLSNTDPLDNQAYIRADSKTHIYKITEKATGKCYIGKTQNQPFFRWWTHLTKSTSPFGKYLRSTKITEWTFEVIEILEWNVPNQEVLKRESLYMLEFNSIENGFNTVISNSSAVNHDLLGDDTRTY